MAHSYRVCIKDETMHFMVGENKLFKLITFKLKRGMAYKFKYDKKLKSELIYGLDTDGHKIRVTMSNDIANCFDFNSKVVYE